MLGIRLSADEEARLTRFARDCGRPKSAVVRQWIVERLEREAVDGMIRSAAALDATQRAQVIDAASDDATTAWLRALDAEDGGYDWGPKGPPL
jgi:predicted DNA-binding protein